MIFLFPRWDMLIPWRVTLVIQKLRTGHQMMLVSDMVLLWDAEFRQHLEVGELEMSHLKQALLNIWFILIYDI